MHQPGRADTTVTGPLAQAPIKSHRPAGAWSNLELPDHRQIVFRTPRSSLSTGQMTEELGAILTVCPTARPGSLDKRLGQLLRPVVRLTSTGDLLGYRGAVRQRGVRRVEGRVLLEP